MKIKFIMLLIMLATNSAYAGSECGKGQVAITVRREVCTDVEFRWPNIVYFSGGEDVANKLPLKNELLTRLPDGSYRMAVKCERDKDVKFERWSDWPHCPNASFIDELEVKVPEPSNQYWQYLTVPTGEASTLEYNVDPD